MSSPLHRILPAVPGSVGHISASHLTAHYGGPTPWHGVDTSSPAAFEASTSHHRCAEIVLAWHSFHVNSNGWLYAAYSSAVCPHGHRYEMRGPSRRTAAQGTNTGNAQSLATVYLAGDDDPLTDAAKVGFLAEEQRFGVPLNRWHSYWIATSCPGDPVRAWVQAGAPHPGGSLPTPQPTPRPRSQEEFVMDAEARREFAAIKRELAHTKMLAAIAVNAAFPDGVNDERGSLIKRALDEAHFAHWQAMLAARGIWPEGVSKPSLLQRIWDRVRA